MAIRLASITINSGATTVTVNSPAIDLTTLVQNGYELMVDGLSLPLTIVSGGNNSLEIAPEDAPSTTLTARAAKIIQTKGPLKEALTGLESARQVLVDFKDSVSAAADADSIGKRDGSGRFSVATPQSSSHAVNKGFLGTAATKNVGISEGNVLGVSAGNNVGVGTENPVSKVHAVGAGSNATVRSESSTSSGGQFRAVNTVGDYSFGLTGATTGDFIVYDNENGKTVASYSPSTGWLFQGGENNPSKFRIFAPTSPSMLISDSTGRTAYYGVNSSNGTVELKCDSALPLTYNANNSERLRIDSSGMLVNGNAVHHAGNLDYLQNTSGGSVASNSTVSGASLTPPKSGTWRNISGGAIANNDYGLWEIV